jgi:signal transduction histidine kinase
MDRSRCEDLRRRGFRTQRWHLGGQPWWILRVFVAVTARHDTRPRILVVDDDAVTRKVAAAKLDTAGFEIEDSGPGMSEDQLERAFDPFYSGNSTKIGMGLAGARKIVELHGGTLSVANRSFGSGVKATLQLRKQV